MASNAGPKSPAPFLGPVYKLPVEILVYIFVLYAQDPAILDRGYFDKDAQPRWCCATLWSPLMLVCRSWRELAVSTPSLWQVVDVGKNTHWLELALVRSREAPIELYFYYLSSARAAVPLVLPHAHRLRRLLLPPLDAPIVYGRSEPKISFFLPLLRTPMPMIVELMLSAYYVNPKRRPAPTEIDVNDATHPKLKVLRLACASIAWTPPVVSRLTILHLRGCTALPMGAPLSRDRFLEILQSCQGLQELQLADMFVSSALGSNAPTAAVALKHPVTLPHLRQLNIGDAPAVTAWFLASIDIPKASDVAVYGWWTSVDELRQFNQSVFAPLLPGEIYGYPAWNFDAPERGHIYIWREDCSFQVSSEKSTLRMEMASLIDEDDWDEFFEQEFLGFTNLFPFSSMKSLSIGGSFPYSDYFWGDVLVRFPNLEELSLNGHGSCVTPLLDALRGYSPLTHSEHDAPASPPPCPRLKILRASLVGFEDEQVEFLLFTLRHRAVHNCGPLELIQLDVLTSDTEEEIMYDEDKAAHREKLLQFCRDLQWYHRTPRYANF